MALPTRSRLQDGRIAGDIPDAELDFARRPRPRWVRPVLVGLVLVTLSVGAVLAWKSAPPVGPVNHSLDYATVLPTTELHDLGGAWVGVVDQSWRGYGDPALRQPDCAALAAKLNLGAGFTVTLMDPEGGTVVECGPGMTMPTPPPEPAQ